MSGKLTRSTSAATMDEMMADDSQGNFAMMLPQSAVYHSAASLQR